MDDRTKRLIAEASSESPLVWAVSYLRLPKNQEWDFNDRRWQVAIFEDPSPNVVVKKCTQVGLTTIMIARMLWFLRHNNARGMYTFPRQDDVRDFVNARLDVMVNNSPALAKVMRGTDNTRLKQIGDSFLHLQEASVPPRMLDVDKLINDEIDLSDPEMLVQYPSRLDASRWKIHHRLSTPTVAGYGIDALYDRTDAKEWMVRCPGCNHWQTMEWDTNLRVSEDKETAWYACSACSHVLAPWDIERGQWIAQNTDHNGPESGYHITQMMMPRMHPPTKLWKMFNETPLKTFFNLRLGKTYSTPGGSLTRDVVLECCFPHADINPRDPIRIEMASSGKEPYYIGYDQGNDLYVLVGKLVEGKMHIVRIEVFPFEERGGWDRISSLAELFKIRFMLGDGTPNVHSARSMSDEFPGRAMIGFEGSAAQRWTINQEKAHVSINQTEMLDMVRDAVLSGAVQFPGTAEHMTPTVAMLVDHLTNMERDEGVRRTQLGDQIYAVWRKTGADHFFHALGHLLLAHEIRPTGILKFDVVGAASRATALEHEVASQKRDVMWRILD